MGQTIFYALRRYFVAMRNQETTKHDYGHALLVAGAYGRMGCAILAARAALRSGCGLLTVHLPVRCVDPMQTALPEAMVSIDSSPTLFTEPPSNLDRYAAVAVGPGIGTDQSTRQALIQLLKSIPPNTPVVLDADALNLMAPLEEMSRSLEDLKSHNLIITPHSREYERLFGNADPTEISRRHNLIIVKKAHHTHIYSPSGQIFENHTGNAGMATAGSGDVLTGILLGMLSSNILHAKTYDIVCRAVEIHGKTGDIALQKQSESSLIASDLIENLRHFSTDIQ